MRKTRRLLSVEPTAPFQRFAAAPPLAVATKLHRDQTGHARKIPVKHLPSPHSPILLKIVAIETYSGNTARLNRRRQFFNRFRST
jgi:hypothetical protein